MPIRMGSRRRKPLKWMATNAAVRNVAAAMARCVASADVAMVRRALVASVTAAAARLRPISATTDPVTMGGIRRSIQPEPQRIVTSAATQYSAAAPAMPQRAYGILEASPPVTASTGPMKAKLDPR